MDADDEQCKHTLEGLHKQVAKQGQPVLISLARNLVVENFRCKLHPVFL